MVSKSWTGGGGGGKSIASCLHISMCHFFSVLKSGYMVQAMSLDNSPLIWLDCTHVYCIS